MNIDDILGKLDAVKATRPGQWSARCPSHKDKRSSLGVGIGSSGRVLIHCMAGCEYRQILSDLGIKGAVRHDGPTPKAAPRKVYTNAYAGPMSLPGLRVTHEWQYRHADGGQAFLVYRLEGRNGKEIRPVVPVEGGYSFGLPPAPRPLYNLPAVVASQGLVVVTEGEKAADAVIRSGYVATTSVGGASAPDKSDWSPLAHRPVLIWPDNDDPGMGYALAVQVILTKYKARVGVARPTGGKGDDAADYSDSGGYIAEIMRGARQGSAARDDATIL